MNSLVDSFSHLEEKSERIIYLITDNGSNNSDPAKPMYYVFDSEEEFDEFVKNGIPLIYENPEDIEILKLKVLNKYSVQQSIRVTPTHY